MNTLISNFILELHINLYKLYYGLIIPFYVILHLSVS